MNKDKAMQMLKAKLYLLKQQEAEEKLFPGIRKVTEIGWGNQISSYVMQPYTMVKDHRTNEETGNVDAVMDGGIDLFINAYLKWISALSKKRSNIVTFTVAYAPLFMSALQKILADCTQV